MANRFDVTGAGFKAAPASKDKQNSISSEAYQTLLSALAEEPEHPTSSIGTFVANSERRKLRGLVERLLCPRQ